MATGFGLSPDGAYFLAVQVDGVRAAPEIRVGDQALDALATDTGWCVPVPGWLWAQDAEAQDALELRHIPDASAGGGLRRMVTRLRPRVLRITRGDVIARLEALAAEDAEDAKDDGGRDDEDALADYARVTALEHAYYGGLFDQVSDPARDWLGRMAGRYGLTHLLPPDLSARPETPDTDPYQDADMTAVTRLLGDLGRAVRAAGAQTAPGFLRDRLEETPLTLPGRLALAEALCAPFCDLDRIGDLYDILLEGDDFQALQPDPDRPWRLSHVLPALMLREDYDRVAEIMGRLAAEPQLWSNTTAVAWTLRRLHDPAAPFLPADRFETILRAGLRYLEGRAGCAVLCATAVGLLRHAPLCSDRMQDEIVTGLIRAYGLSPDFWARLEDAAPDLSPDLAARLDAARAAARALQQGGDGAATRTALAHLVEAGCRDAPRAALELDRDGPEGARAEAGDAALLRRLADPEGDPAAQDPALRARAAAALRAAYPGLPLASHAAAEHRMMGAAFALLSAARMETGIKAADIQDLLAGLTRLAGQATGFCGLALSLALIRDLERAGAADAAAQLATGLAPVLTRVARNAGPALATAPALRSVLGALRASPDSPALAALLAVLPADADAPPLPDIAPGLPAHWATCPALFDTLVVVYSCRAHLDTRIPALRAGWLRDLERFAIPYVIVVGSDHTALEGDVLHVATSDSYEALPRKTLAMIDWVFEQTGFAHLLKIDDDCHLNVAAYFLDPAWRRFDYYGHRLNKRDGQVDRCWHQARSTDPAARLALEKLPRHALYADGGTGYALSRRAMAALRAERARPRGQALVAGAFSEDKLVGALLAPAGITPSEQNYHTAVFRRLQGSGPAVPCWVSGSFPDPLGVTRVAHLDAPDARADTPAAPDRLIAPPRIWPTDGPPRLGYNSRALHLIGRTERLAVATGAEVAVICVLRNERLMLPHFLAHYRALGVTGFLIVDNGSTDGSLEYLQEQPDVALFAADTEFRAADQGTDWKRALLARYRMDRWAVVADTDEFLLYPGWPGTPLAAWLRALEGSGADAVGMRMLDMYPQGPLAAARLDRGTPFDLAGWVDRRPFLATSLSRGPFSDAPTWTSAVRHRLMPGSRPELFVAQKVALLRYRPWMRLSTSLHYAADVHLVAPSLIFAHFKYHADFEAKARREIARGQYFNNAEEYRRYLALAGSDSGPESGGGVIYDPAVSVPWRDCADIRALLGSDEPAPGGAD